MERELIPIVLLLLLFALGATCTSAESPAHPVLNMFWTVQTLLLCYRECEPRLDPFRIAQRSGALINTGLLFAVTTF
jgi:hypothetical protein